MIILYIIFSPRIESVKNPWFARTFWHFQPRLKPQKYGIKQQKYGAKPQKYGDKTTKVRNQVLQEH